MKRWIPVLLAVLQTLLPLTSFAADEAAGVKPETTTLYRAAREQVDKLGTSPAAKYAADVIGEAKTSVAQAQAGLEAGNDQTTRAAAERAILQAKLALAVTEERVAAEKTAAAQKELASLEQRLSAILAGKGEQP